MNSIWLSLLWKEWCEFRWKLAALVGISVVTPFAIVATVYCMSSVEIPEADIPEALLAPQPRTCWHTHFSQACLWGCP